MKWLAVFGAVAVAGMLLGWGMTSHHKTEAQRAIIRDVRGLIEPCRRAGNNITLIGKVLVWDLRTDARSAAHSRLPGLLQARAADTPLTVFMITGERRQVVGTYAISRQPAYRQYLDIAVATWPEKQPVGCHAVVSQDPRSWRPVQHRPEYGDPHEPVARWIASLPRQ